MRGERAARENRFISGHLPFNDIRGPSKNEPRGEWRMIKCDSFLRLRNKEIRTG